MKKCSKCKKVRPLTDFYKDRSLKDGLKHTCKICDNKQIKKYRRTKTGILNRIYHNQKQSSIIRGHKPPAYTRKEFIIFALSSNQFNSVYEKWVKSNYNKWKVPSFDRKNDYMGYSFDNFNKWMTWRENTLKNGICMRMGINNKISKAVIGIDKNTGEEVNFYSINEASRQTGINNGHISRCCNGIRKSAGGYMWRFKI